VSDEVRLKADSPVKVNPLRFPACVKVPVTLLPLPVRLPEGTVNDTMRPFRLAMFERLAQPVPEHAADAVVKGPPVSTPAVVRPRSKFPPETLMVICTGAAQSVIPANTPSKSSLYDIFLNFLLDVQCLIENSR